MSPDPAHSRHYVVTVQHRCGDVPPSTHEVTAANLSALLRHIREGDCPQFACPNGGPHCAMITSVEVVVEAEDLRGRLGPFAGELLASA